MVSSYNRRVMLLNKEEQQGSLFGPLENREVCLLNESNILLWTSFFGLLFILLLLFKEGTKAVVQTVLQTRPRCTADCWFWSDLYLSPAWRKSFKSSFKVGLYKNMHFFQGSFHLCGSDLSQNGCSVVILPSKHWFDLTFGLPQLDSITIFSQWRVI